MTSRRSSRSLNERELRLWKVGRALVLTFVAAVLVAGGVFYGLVVLLDFKEIGTTAKLDAKTLFDLVKLSFGVVAGAGALVALVVAYRRQRVDEAGAHREATRLHTERFSQAVDKLGSDSPAVRLGGVHALAGLADDAPDDNLRQTCIDVLCAYLRLPFSPDPGDLPGPLPDGTSPSEERRDAHQDKRDRYRALREVRHTILRLIGDRYCIPKGTQRSWQGYNLDLTRVVIDSGVDLNFGGAMFSGGTVDFGGATFSGGSVYFGGAMFSGGTVDFGGATFSGSRVDFLHVTFSGGRVNFCDVTFSGGRVDFIDVTFSGGRVDFGPTAYTGGRVRGAMFSGGTVDFGGATFSGSRVAFRGATFSGGTVDFGHAMFSGGRVDFGGAMFSGSTVNFDYASGPAPHQLLSAVGTPAPAEVNLPSAWLPPIP
ncbi:pentapeptide repeat-containing protein [Streptomyces sp. NBC_01237]|uniref:pentapeptide repeat-containing protein n=1 Tax=Streptomyces sp. NBC_01237 TaxID=2903790 RepID=UPI002DD7F603|nr:pentapeptide repeat-containing protein [Streptomyces sp. NBC_01237]WRZ76440.1 pentapeptide repeat-containing protein [Streptomyces sp. NBC_01237]